MTPSKTPKRVPSPTVERLMQKAMTDKRLMPQVAAQIVYEEQNGIVWLEVNKATDDAKEYQALKLRGPQVCHVPNQVTRDRKKQGITCPSV